VIGALLASTSVDDFLVTQVDRLEMDNHLSGESTTWTVHFVSPPGEPDDDIRDWGDLSTDDANIAALFQPGQRWTLSRT
jgi:hypothetical protein